MVIAETNRLILRPFTPDDVDALEDVFGDPEVMRFGPGPQMRGWIAGWIRQRIENGETEKVPGPWAVVEKGTLALVGYCGVFYFAELAGSAEVEIGYRLARRAWGKGYATEAALVVRDDAFERLALRRLVALIDPANIRSLRVALKLGMHFEREVLLEGYDHPDHLYVLERPAWEKLRTIRGHGEADPHSG